KEQKIRDSASLLFYGGAYINRHLSVELGYVGFNTRNAYTVIDDAGKEKSLSLSSFNVSTLAHYAFFDDILDFYAKFGVGEVSASGVGESGFTMLYGGGIGVRFSDRISVKIAYDRYMIEYNKERVKHDMRIDYIYSAFEVQF
ncbi:MAG: outer membrane beta-barrel protein, partial [Campylobacterota bacterium]|nr:outer membrane beta-barrel protein [Campylobacterota bacterium]